MQLPDPQLGLVISYSYLWHHEHRKGRDEGVKDRPCVIVLSVERQEDGVRLVTVVPVTHSEPDGETAAIELPAKVKAHLGLDNERSWIILDEVNRFAWPGFDLRPVPRDRDRCDYGFIPPALHTKIVQQLQDVWRQGQGTTVPRD